MKATIAAPLVSAVLLAAPTLLAAPAWAQSGGVMAVSQGPNTQTYDIPAGAKPQTVIITTRSFKQGESATPHIHNGVEMTEVIRGDVELYIKGQPVKVIHAGESFIVPREVPHDARPVPGSGRADLAVTLVIDKGTAPRTPVKDMLIPPGK